MTPKKGALGRNILLDTLGKTKPEASVSEPKEGIVLIGIHQVDRSPWQPRSQFESEPLQDLANSIRQHGLMQPLVVREVNQRYELIAGERRWRAAQIADLKQVPAVVQTVDDRTAATLALVENLQREDLNALEQGQALIKLRDEFSLDQTQLSELVGLSRSQVSNLMRLDSLDHQVKDLVHDGSLDMGHARALLAAPTARQRALASKVVALGLNVRQTETLVANESKAKSAPAQPDADVLALTQRISEQLGAQVEIRANKKGRGQIQIRYNTLDEFQGLLKKLGLES
ncbi:MAG: ParB/RepB/Spo0J family partition protein [Pseudomonadales bacterium]|jgi:ParB family chromosome partitioning protein